MLLDGHNLNAVVAVFDDTRQYIILEFGIGAHLLGIFAHSDMAFVDQEWIGLGFESLLFPFIRLWSPHLCREYLRVLVLHNTLRPSWNTLAIASVPMDVHLIEISVFKSLGWQFQLPVSCSLNTFSLVFLVFLPIVEITNQVYFGSIGSPLAEHPASTRCLVKSEIVVSTRKIGQGCLSVASELV